MKELWYIMIVKANGLRGYFGKRNIEVYPVEGAVDAEDSAVGYENEDDAQKNWTFIENYCRTMGILTTEMKLVTLVGR